MAISAQTQSRQFDTTLLVWVCLMVLTSISWYVGESPEKYDHSGVVVSILIVTFIKIRLVIMHFMEVKNAQLPLRLAFDAWCIVVATALIGVFMS